MSRIGNRKLVIPENVTVDVSVPFHIKISGPKGVLAHQYHKSIAVVIKENSIQTTRHSEHKSVKQQHGTTNALIHNMLTGVAEGFHKKLLLHGVGYRARLQANKLEMSLGYSHLITYLVPADVTVKVPKPTIIELFSHDKQLLGQTAAEIRAFKKPEPYKGKGIMYENEVIRRKEGKSVGK